MFPRSATFPPFSKQLFLVSVFLYGLLYAVPLFLMATPTREKGNTSSSIEEKELFLICHEKAVSNNLK